MGKLWEPGERYYSRRFNRINKRRKLPFFEINKENRSCPKVLWQVVASLLIFLLVWVIFQFDSPVIKPVQGKIRSWFTVDYSIEPVLKFFSNVGLWGDTLDRAAFEVSQYPPAAEPLTIPVSGQIIKPFGWIIGAGADQVQTFHDGIVIAAPEGTPIKASLAGVVTRIANEETLGRVVDITGENGIVSSYGHCSEILVSLNDKVQSDRSLPRWENRKSGQRPALFQDNERGSPWTRPCCLYRRGIKPNIRLPGVRNNCILYVYLCPKEAGRILVELRNVLEYEILPGVLKPLRYIGRELNAVQKNWDAVKLRTLFAFPDLYEVGMSHLGLRILYHLVNDQPGFLMERVFAPWTDMEQAMRDREIPLFSLESWRPIRDFDCIGFTLQYEMSYTNILNMLDLGKIPLKAADRDDSYPLIIAGGPCASNPEPLADFFDLFVVGEGEEIILEIFRIIAEHREKRGGQQEKAALLTELDRLAGVYIPAYYKPVYTEDGTLKGMIRNGEGRVARPVVKRVVRDLDKSYYPLKPIVPYLEVVHDRIMLEVLRGCARGCRFCQAGMIYRPVRERSSKLLLEQAAELVKNTGYHEIALTSLSAVITPVSNRWLPSSSTGMTGRRSIVSASLRVDSFSLSLARNRCSGLEETQD